MPLRFSQTVLPTAWFFNKVLDMGFPPCSKFQPGLFFIPAAGDRKPGKGAQLVLDRLAPKLQFQLGQAAVQRRPIRGLVPPSVMPKAARTAAFSSGVQRGANAVSTCLTA